MGVHWAAWAPTSSLQLPLGCGKRILPWLQLACRYLQKHPSIGIAKLADHMDIALAVDGHHDHCAGMADDFPPGGVAVHQLHSVVVYLQQPAIVDQLAAERFFIELHVIRLPNLTRSGRACEIRLETRQAAPELEDPSRETFYLIGIYYITAVRASPTPGAEECRTFSSSGTRWSGPHPDTGQPGFDYIRKRPAPLGWPVFPLPP